MIRDFRNPQYREWHKEVLAKNDNRCFDCGCVATHAHHIKGWWESPELRFVVANGRALCKPCHEETHGFKFVKSKMPIATIEGLAYKARVLAAMRLWECRVVPCS